MDHYQITQDESSDRFVDNVLVEEAFQAISNIYLNKISETYYAVGEYILERFFEGNIEFARNKSGKNINSFYALEMKFNPKNKEKRIPSKSWIYNAINLVVDRHDMNKSTSYQRLSISHKIELLPIKDLAKKEQLSELIIKYNLSVQKTRKSIYSTKIHHKKGLLSLISQPELLYTDDYKEICSIKNLRKIDEQKREKTLQKARHKLEKIQTELDERKVWVKNLKKLVKEIEKL